MTQPRSRPVRYRLVAPDGFVEGIFNSPKEAVEAAARWWPGVEQDEDRQGWGWDLEVAR